MGSNPVQQFVSDVSNGINEVADNVVSGVSNTANSALDNTFTDARELTERGLDSFGRGVVAGVDKLGRELGRGVGDITGKNQMERGMKDAADRQEAENNRLLWERDNRIAQNKEADAQAEARKRLRAAQGGGRSGTILTGFGGGTSTQLGAGGGTDILGA